MLCPSCEYEISEISELRANARTWEEWNDDDADDGEHHSACTCAECNPDFLFDLARENRYDAERSAS